MQSFFKTQIPNKQFYITVQPNRHRGIDLLNPDAGQFLRNSDTPSMTYNIRV